MIVGKNYQIAFATGIEYPAVTFEQRNDDALFLDDRFMKVAVSLIWL